MHLIDRLDLGQGKTKLLEETLLLEQGHTVQRSYKLYTNNEQSRQNIQTNIQSDKQKKTYSQKNREKCLTKQKKLYKRRQR